MEYLVGIKKIDDPGGSPLAWSDSTIDKLALVIGDIIEKTGFNLKTLRNASIMLHPNLVRPHTTRPASFSDPRVILATAKLMQDVGVKEISVGENPGFGYPARKAFHESGLISHLNKMNVKTLYFDESEWMTVNNPEARLYHDVTVSKHLMDCDCFVNIPKMKTHMLTQVSLCVKNVLGVIHDDQRMLFHRNDIADKVVDLNLLRMPDLNIVDGLWPMEGQAPFHGDAIEGFNVIVAGKNAAAVDAVCCRVMGFEVNEVPHVQLALKRICNIRDYNESVVVKGDSIGDVKRRFKRPVLSSMAQFGFVECIECGVCNGCLSAIRHSLDWLKMETDCSNIPVATVVSGRPMPNMNTLNRWKGELFLFGNCAAEFQFFDADRRNKGIWVPGCPPHVLDLAKLIKNINQ